jgi:hypothetical protein
MDLIHKKLKKEIEAVHRRRRKDFSLSDRDGVPDTDYLATMIIAHKRFLDTEILTHHLIEFFAFNPGEFNVLMGSDIYEYLKINEDENLNEVHMSEISELVMQRKIFLYPTGIFEAWTMKRTKYKLTYDMALEICADMVKGGI